MSRRNPRQEKKIKRRLIGEIPILQSMADKLGFRKILAKRIRPHGNEAVPAVDTLMSLIYNLAGGRQPLYELEDWMGKIDPRLFGYSSRYPGVFNDDRFGRALDKLYLTDRASLMTEIAIHLVKVLDLDLSRIHNDSTTVKAYGKIGGITYTGFYLARGHSKDHRPDLKQLVYCLTISADGAVPIHYKSYPGNRTDDTTHIETWNIIRKIAGFADFLYVADCKVCTDKQLHYIVSRMGRVVSVMPDTWDEAKTFKDSLRSHKKVKKVIHRRKIPGYEGEDECFYETFSRFSGNYKTKKRGYPLHWIYSTEKKKRDRAARKELLSKAERDLTNLMGRINTRDLKTKKQIKGRVNNILEKHGVAAFYHINISEVKERYRVQKGKGRPGPDTKYRIITNRVYSLSWTRNKIALAQEKNVDGIFPIICTDKSMSSKEALLAYKYQPRLEKRFTQFKSVHNAAPLLFKKIERVEAIMFLFFLALILQAVIEREVRKKMKKHKIDNLPIYPEHRLAYHPTTAIIFDRFEEISLYQLKEKGKVIEEFKDTLNKTQIKILKLLNIKEHDYWPE